VHVAMLGPLVSSGSGGRLSGQPAGSSPARCRSRPVRMNPRSSRSIALGSQPVRGSAPIITNSAAAGTVSMEIRWRIRRLQAGPSILRITGRSGLRRATTWKPCRAKAAAIPGNKLRV